MISIKQHRFYFLFLSFFIFLLDQITKNIIKFKYDSFLNKNFILFNLDLVKNTGAAFNIFSGSRIFLSLVSLIITLVLLYLIIKNKNLEKIDLYSYSFILAGTMGNGIDRITKGYVLDFINLNFINFPVFNIADISINIGFLFFLYSLFKYRK